jgi:hypothetical protein
MNSPETPSFFRPVFGSADDLSSALPAETIAKAQARHARPIK